MAALLLEAQPDVARDGARPLLAHAREDELVALAHAWRDLGLDDGGALLAALEGGHLRIRVRVRVRVWVRVRVRVRVRVSLRVSVRVSAARR